MYLESVAFKVHLELMAILETPAMLVHPVLQVVQVRSVYKDLLEFKDLWEPLDLRDLLVHKDYQDDKGSKVLQGKLDSPVHKVNPESPENLEVQDQLVHQELPGKMVIPVTQDCPGNREKLEIRGAQVLLEGMELLELWACVAPLVAPDLVDLQDLWVHQVHKEQLDPQGQKDPLDQSVTKELPVQADPKDQTGLLDKTDHKAK